MIGSRMTGCAIAAAFFSAWEPAILNAISDESTSWNAPSRRVSFKFTRGYPARMPYCIASCAPASTEGMYSRGMRPPVTLFSNS